MNLLKNLLEKFQEFKNPDYGKEPIKTKQKFQKSERAEIVKKFVDRLNIEREKAGYKPMKASFYAIKMAQAGLKTNGDLYWFYRYCDDAKNFSSCWWWSLSAKNAKDKK